MANAAVTFVYNEFVNLPIWVNYYGCLFGYENLFVIDRSSTDGSTDNLGQVNVVRIPRDEFDEHAKTNLMSSFHAALTSCYDCVIISDCDELLVPDPARYRDLSDYIGRFEREYVNAIGIDVVHILTEEAPLDVSRAILTQRSFGRFHTPECKHLLSRIPIKWLPGLHSSNKKPVFDSDLIIFHLKLMDYSTAVAHQMVNLETTWSTASLQRNYGQHHRYPLSQFVRQSFFVPLDLLNRKQIAKFEFNDEIAEIESKVTVDGDGNYRIPMNISKMVSIPERFRATI